MTLSLFNQNACRGFVERFPSVYDTRGGISRTPFLDLRGVGKSLWWCHAQRLAPPQEECCVGIPRWVYIVAVGSQNETARLGIHALEVLRMSQASFQVFILGGPRPNYPRAFISLAADNSGTIQFWDDGETIPSDSQGTMNLPVSMFAAVLDWLGNEQNPHLYDSGVGFEYLTSFWEATGQGEIVRSPIAPHLARLGKV